ncbi:MAG: hypothetical protein IKV41_06940 [Oscillospiraceae bacterium]|nr:hypothetical protein [Oscillospiraceae bacterium]
MNNKAITYILAVACVCSIGLNVYLYSQLQTAAGAVEQLNNTLQEQQAKAEELTALTEELQNKNTLLEESVKNLENEIAAAQQPAQTSAQSSGGGISKHSNGGIDPSSPEYQANLKEAYATAEQLIKSNSDDFLDYFFAQKSKMLPEDFNKFKKYCMDLNREAAGLQVSKGEHTYISGLTP